MITLLFAALVSGSIAKDAAFTIDADNGAVRVEAVTSADAIEFFFIPDGGAFEFYSFRLTKDGEREAHFRSEFGGIEPDPYGPIWKGRADRQADGPKDAATGKWTARMEIPLHAFYMTRQSVWKTAWKVNAATYRGEETAVWQGAAKPTEKAKFLNAFRKVEGFPERHRSEDFLIQSAVAIVTGMQDGKPAGKLRLEVRGWRDADYQFASSWSKPQTVRVPFGGGHVELDAVFPSGGRHPTEIVVKCGEAKSIGRVWPLYVDFQPIKVKLTTPQCRNNFYPGQNASKIEGEVICLLEGEVEIAAVDAEGKRMVRRTASTKPGFSFDVPPEAKFPITITASCAGRKCVKTVRKLEPLAAGRHMSWIENGNLIVDGKPVCRRGIYAVGFMGGKAFGERFAADDLFLTKDITCIANLDPSWYSKDLRKNEMKLDQEPSARMKEWLDINIKKGLSATNGCYYYICDEPECAGISAVQLRHIYEYVAEKDPYHVIAACCRSGETYIDIADWFETHPYINAHYSPDGRRIYGRDFRELGGYVDAFRPEEHPEKCIGGTPTAFAYTGGDYPTFTEYVLNYWCEFVRGAKTMYAYAYHDLGDRPSIYEGTRYMFESMKALEEVLLFGRRRTLVKNENCEVCEWTMPEGDRMFAAVNFTQKPQKVEVPGLAGSYREFRGNRTFIASPSPIAITLSLAPLESLIACEKSRDGGLKTFAEVKAEIETLEYERSHRDNQLAGRERDMDVVTSFGRRGAWRDDAIKVFDGTRDVIAWRDEWSKQKFFEMAFTRFVPNFRKITVYGHNIDGMEAKIRENGEWKTLKPTAVEKDGYRRTLCLDRDYSTVKLRLEFPKNHVEVYEIELPGKAREIVASSAEPEPKGVRWTLDTPPFEKHTIFKIRQPAKRSFLVFSLGELPFVEEKAYHNWQLHLMPQGGVLCAEVGRPLAGLYTLAMPGSPTGEERPVNLKVYDWNIRFGLGKLVCCDEPANSALLTEEEGYYCVKVTLASPCEDVVCSFYEDTGLGPHPFRLSNGRNSLDLKPVDQTRTVWEAKVAVDVSMDAKRRPFPMIRVNVLGGAITDPIYTWLAR